MSLRPLLRQLAHDADGVRLAREGGRAFVSLSLRPYLVAALLDGGRRRARRAGRPAIVVAGDDRQAQDLAADLRAWLHPRPVRFYPSRGVAYESHLAPPPHLVGLRVAALDALLDLARERAGRRAAGRRRLGGRAEREGPRPGAAPARLHAAQAATSSTSTRSPPQLVGAGYERVDQVDDRGQFAIRGGILDVFPATEDHAVRVDLFDIEIESLRHFSTFTQRSLGDLDAVEIAPAAELAPEHRELAEIAAISDADERPDIAELLPIDRFHALLDLAPGRRRGAHRRRGGDRARARRPLAGRLRRVPRRGRPPASTSRPGDVRAALDERARIRLSSMSVGPAARVPRAVRGRRRPLDARGRARARAAGALGLPHGRRVRAPRRGRARRLQPRPAARARGSTTIRARRPRRRRRRRRRLAALRARDAARRVHRRRAAPRGHPRAPAVPPPTRRAHRRPERRPAPARAAGVVHRAAHRRHRRPRGPRRRALRRLRDEDRRRHHARLPRARVRGHGQGLHAGRPAREDHALRRRGGGGRRRRSALASSAASRGRRSRRARAAPPRSSPASCSTSTPSAGGARATPSRRTRPGRSSSRAGSPGPRDRRPGRGDRGRQGRHGAPAADGPPDLRRRRLREDRGRAARGVQGGERRQAGARPRADDDPRPAAPRNVRRAAEGLPVHDRRRQPLPLGRRSSARSSPRSTRARSTS